MEEAKVEFKRLLDLIGADALYGYVMVDFGDGLIKKVTDDTEIIIMRKFEAQTTPKG